MTNLFAKLNSVELTTYYGSRKNEVSKTGLLIHQGNKFIELENIDVPLLIKALEKFLILNPIEK